MVRRIEPVPRWCGITPDKSRSAASDAETDARVLWRLLEDANAAQARFGALLEEEWRRFGNAVYLDRTDARPRIGFGAHCGKPLEEVDREYLRWCLGEMKDLTEEARGVMESAARAG